MIKAILTNWRYWIIAAMGLMGVFGLCVDPDDTSSGLIISAICFPAMVWSTRHWLKAGHLPDLARIMDSLESSTETRK